MVGLVLILALRYCDIIIRPYQALFKSTIQQIAGKYVPAFSTPCQQTANILATTYLQLRNITVEFRYFTNQIIIQCKIANEYFWTEQPTHLPSNLFALISVVAGFK